MEVLGSLECKDRKWLSHVSSEIGAGTFSTIVSLIDFKQFQNDALSGFHPSSSSFRDFSVWNAFLFESRFCEISPVTQARVKGIAMFLIFC